MMFGLRPFFSTSFIIKRVCHKKFSNQYILKLVVYLNGVRVYCNGLCLQLKSILLQTFLTNQVFLHFKFNITDRLKKSPKKCAYWYYSCQFPFWIIGRYRVLYTSNLLEAHLLAPGNHPLFELWRLKRFLRNPIGLTWFLHATVNDICLILD